MITLIKRLSVCYGEKRKREGTDTAVAQEQGDGVLGNGSNRETELRCVSKAEW